MEVCVEVIINSPCVGDIINWKILKRARCYNPASDRCNLCLWEKYSITFEPTMATLNKRNELVSSCRHYKKFKKKPFK